MTLPFIVRVDAVFRGGENPERGPFGIGVAEGKIAWIERGGHGPAGWKGSERSLGWGLLAMPGLVESHAHLFLDGEELDGAARARRQEEPADLLLRRAARNAARSLRCGITAIRDAADKHGVVPRIAGSGGGPWPELRFAGRALYREGRYGSFLGDPVGAADEFAARVETEGSRGASWIKILVSGVINFRAGRVTSPPQFSTQEVAAIVAEARRRGLRVIAHASGAEAVGIAVEGGADSVEHGFFVTPATLEEMARRGTAWCPTFAPVAAQRDHAGILGWGAEVRSSLDRILDGHAGALGRARGLGVRIVAGSDAGSAGVPHGSGLHREIELLAGAGLGPWEAIEAATLAGARLFDGSEAAGGLAPGGPADFILVDDPGPSGSPIPLRVRAVFRRGEQVGDGLPAVALVG